MMRLKLCLLLIVLSLAGCCTSRCQLPPVIEPSPNDSATVQLAEAAASISRSLTQLSAIQQANTPTPCICLPITRACEMQNLVSVDYAGPIGPLVDRIGCMANYRVRKLGRPPAIPVLVAINARNTPLADVLRDVAFQAGTKACVVVCSNQRIIELRYRHMCEGGCC
jgi:defect-in-organelle-trafficking protein DotD